VCVATTSSVVNVEMGDKVTVRGQEPVEAVDTRLEVRVSDVQTETRVGLGSDRAESVQFDERERVAEFVGSFAGHYPGPSAAISAPTVALASAGFGSLSTRCVHSCAATVERWSLIAS
jgi:hypothetical protein